MVSIDPQGNHPRFIPTGRQHLCCTRTPTESAVGRRHDICVDLVGLGVRGDRDRRVRPDDPGLPHLDLDDDATGARCGRARDLDPWPPRGRPSGWGDPSHRRPVHLGPVLERLAEAGIRASVGTVGDSFDNALAETINGLYKTEVIKHRGPWRTVDKVEYATAEWSIGSTTAGSTSTAETFRQQNWRPPTTVSTSSAVRSGAQKLSDETRRCDSFRTNSAVTIGCDTNSK